METLHGLVVSHCPNINKVSATVILQRHWSDPLPVVDLWGLHDCPESQMTAFENAGLFPVDIGLNYYKTTGHESAPESIAKELGFFQDLTSGERELIKLVGLDNSRRGSLKKWPMSFAWFVRFAYHLPRFSDKNNQISLIEKFRSAVDVFVDGLSGTDEDKKRDPKHFAEAFTKEETLVAKCQFAPLTVGRYLRDLWVSGSDEKHIQNVANFWLSVYSEVENQLESARRSLSQNKLSNFWTRNGLEGVVLETPSFFMTYAASGSDNADIVVAKNPKTGHSVIKTKRKNLSSLARKLYQLEPGLWEYDFKTGHLINGGPMYPATVPTSQSASELASLVQEFPPQ